MSRIGRNPALTVTVALAVAITVAAPAQGADQGESDPAALHPLTLRGRPLDVETSSGSEWVARWDADDPDDAAVIARTEEFVASLDKDLNDLTIGTALNRPSPEDDLLTLTAVRVRDAAAWDFAESAVTLMAGEIERPRFEAFSTSGKGILRVTDRATPGAVAVTAYPAGDTVWLVRAADYSLVEEILGALPPMPLARPSATATLDLEETFPIEIGGRPWSELVLASGAGILPVLGRAIIFSTGASPGNPDVMVPPHVEPITDTFLSSGARLDDLSVAFGMAEKPAVFLGAYQIAGADEAAMWEDLDERLIPLIVRYFKTFNSDYRKVGRDSATIGGKVVARLWDASDPFPDRTCRSMPLYFHVSGDTIWAVSACKEATATEVLERLPASTAAAPILTTSTPAPKPTRAPAGRADVTVVATGSGCDPVRLKISSGDITRITLHNRGRVTYDYTIEETGFQIQAAPGKRASGRLKRPDPGTYQVSCAGQLGFLIVRD